MNPCSEILTCPVCGDRLIETNRMLRCSRNHSFDQAREGYFNLLPSGHGLSGIKGDSAEMVQARRRFLRRGYYEPLSEAINETCTQYCARLRSARSSPGRFVVADVGCGEGYYIGRLKESASRPVSGAQECYFGFDVSKEALRIAARAYRDIRFAVNDVKYRICLADRSVDVLLNVFAPRNPAEFERVIHPDGLLIVVIPTERHLQELRACVPMLGIEPDKLERTVELFRTAFHPIGEKEIEYRKDVGPGESTDLLRMTPSFWHLDLSTSAQALPPASMELTMSFTILRFQKGGFVRVERVYE